MRQQTYLILEISITMKRSLIIGMGIGQLYKDVLTNLGHEVITVDLDPDKQANFTSTSDALKAYGQFDTVHICTPNFLHQSLAEFVAPQARIVFVEKPGFETAEQWETVCNRYPLTRFMMVKNNMWRDNIKDLQRITQFSEDIQINWINKDRVPSPGTWFTTKKLSYGGVSRDLMPHLLSLFAALEPDYDSAKIGSVIKAQIWGLDELTSTDYGKVKSDGTHDVDDFYQIKFELGGRRWTLTSDWRSLRRDEQCVKFNRHKLATLVSELGLCPESAYQNMIADAVEHIEDDKFWNEQYNIDMWIHNQIALIPQ